MAATATLLAIVLINLWLHLALRSVFVRCIWSLCHYFLIDFILFVPSCTLYLFVSVIYCFFVRCLSDGWGEKNLSLGKLKCLVILTVGLCMF